MSAAAAAPMLAAVVARHAQDDAGPGELLGVTPVMAALLSFAAFLFVTTVIEPLFLKR